MTSQTQKRPAVAGPGAKNTNSPHQYSAESLDLHRQFIDAMIDAGVAPSAPDNIIADGRLRRFHVEGDKRGSLNGWCVLFGDGIPSGAFGSWKAGINGAWCARDRNSLSRAEWDELRRRMESARTARLADQDRVNDKALERLRRLWRESEPLDLARHDAVARYFERRGLALADHPHDLRYHPRLPYWAPGGDRPVHVGDYPAILGVVRGPDGRVATLHRTHLSSDGRKADVASPRKLCPPCRKNGLRGAAIRLYEAGERLVVAEGLETALAVHTATGWPVWSCISAGGLATVEIPDCVRELVVAADNDEAGLRAAEDCARRLSKQCTVRIVAPDEPGTDWADHGGSRHDG